MVKATKLTLAAALLAASCSYALAQGTGSSGGTGGEPPKASDANPPAPIKQQPGEAKSAPAQGAQAPAPSMQSKETGMSEPNSTGNMNTKGTGKGTTGTGGPGGSGNK
jgi:hypothetical protein